MKCGIIYFSATGNTEFVAKEFKKRFEENKIECTLTNIVNNKNFDDDYDFFVFGCPTHVDVFPDIYIKWIENNILEGNNRKCIIFSTQAAKSATGTEQLGIILKNKNYNIVVKDFITMPNNYYIIAFKEPSKNDIQICKKNASKQVKLIVENFISGKKSIKNVSKLKLYSVELVYKAYGIYAYKWAKRNLKVDKDICARCKKCVNNCPTKNIRLEDEIIFGDKCITCQSCIHICPVNAITYKGKKVRQYKI